MHSEFESEAGPLEQEDRGLPVRPASFPMSANGRLIGYGAAKYRVPSYRTSLPRRFDPAPDPGNHDTAASKLPM